MSNRRSVRRKARHAGLVWILVLLIGSLSAGAQGPDLVIQDALLRIWPEYDDPGLLIILSGSFAGTTPFPQDVTFELPEGTRNIVTAYPDASGSLLEDKNPVIAAGKLTYRPPVPAFQLEYYLDRQPSSDQREIQYVFVAPYAIENLDVSVQQPARATAFSISPPEERTQIGVDGLTDHLFSRTKLAAGERLEIAVRYTKPDSGLSQPRLVVTDATAAPAASATAGAGDSSGPMTWLPWLLIGLGGASLLGLLAYWWLQRRQPVAPPAQPVAAPVAAREKQAPDPRPAAAGGSAFCTQCGHPLRQDDRFCSQCGTPRRT